MRYGYIRTWPGDNDADLQHQMLKGVGFDQFFADKGVAGGFSKCAGLKACLAVLKPHDTLIVWRLDKLGRNLHELVKLLDELQKCGSHLYLISERLNTAHPQHGDVIERVFKAMVECGKNQLVRRTQEGALKAKAHGNKGGRPVKLTDDQLERASQMLESGVTHGSVAHFLGVHRTTLTRNLATYSPTGHKKESNPDSKNGKGLFGWFSKSP